MIYYVQFGGNFALREEKEEKQDNIYEIRNRQAEQSGEKKKKNTNLRGKSTSKNRKERANDYFDAIGKVSNRPFVIKMDSLQRCLYLM